MEITDILMAIMVLAYSITIFSQDVRGPQVQSESATAGFSDWAYYWESQGGGADKPSSWFTKSGKILLSTLLVIIFGLNVFVFKSDWMATILFSMFIIFNYADYFRMEGYSTQCVEEDGGASAVAKTCSIIIPSNKYYAEKYYELRIGYGTLILGTALVLAYRDIKSSCDNNINKIVLMISPLLMMLGLLLISYMVGDHDDDSITNTSFDYIHSYFKGIALDNTGKISASPTHDTYTSYITSTYGYNDRSDPINKEISRDPGVNDGETQIRDNKLSRIQNKIYFKMFLLVAFFGYLWYWALNSDGTCDFDFTSPGKLFSKSPTYMIIFIVLSPFIIKNIMMNECLITTAEATYDHYEKVQSDAPSPGKKDNNFGGGELGGSADYSNSGTLSCMFDKIGGLGIYLLMCMLCILIYSSSRVGQTLNVPMVTILLSGILGYMISPSGELNCTTGVSSALRTCGDADGQGTQHVCPGSGVVLRTAPETITCPSSVCTDSTCCTFPTCVDTVGDGSNVPYDCGDQDRKSFGAGDAGSSTQHICTDGSCNSTMCCE